MGKRIHVAKKYKVEYALGDGFNWKTEEFRALLSTMDCYVTGGEFTDEWEVSTNEYDETLGFLKKHKDDIYNYEEADKTFDNGYYSYENIYDAIMELSDKEAESGDSYETFVLRYNEVIDNMEYFKKARQKNDEYMHFAAF